MKLEFTIPGKPQAKQRPRMNRKTGRVYTQKATRDYEKFVGAHAEDAIFDLEMGIPSDFWGCNGGVIPSGVGWKRRASYKVTLKLYFPDKRRRDIDNVAKAICDGMNGVVYDDDSQIKELVIRREMDRGRPRAEVIVEVVE